MRGKNQISTNYSERVAKNEIYLSKNSDYDFDVEERRHTNTERRAVLKTAVAAGVSTMFGALSLTACGGGGGDGDGGSTGSASASPATPIENTTNLNGTTANAHIASSYIFKSSGIVGGGFQNSLAISPFKDSSGNRPYIVAADVSGLHYSLDRAKTWQPVGGVYLKMADVLWSDTVPGECFAASDNTLFRSINFGVTWLPIETPSSYDQDANGAYKINGQEHPRPTGNMLAQDNTGPTKYLWVATATKGVQRRDNGVWIPSSALMGRHLRSIAVDPNNCDIMYAAVSDDGVQATSGVYISTNARGAMTFKKMADYPPTLNAASIEYTEELFIVNDNGTSKLYVAGNNNGILQYSKNTWVSLNNGVDVGGSIWLGITGHIRNGIVNLYACCVLGLPDTRDSNSRRRSIIRSQDGGVSWTSISSGGNCTVDYTVYGTNTPSWFKDIKYHQFARSSQWTGAKLLIDPDFPDNLIVPGRGGVWVGTVVADKWKWQPAINGLMVTVNKTIAVHPKRGEIVVWSDADYPCLVSTDHGATVRHNPSGLPVTQAAIKGDIAVFDDKTGFLYLSTSPRGIGNGAGAIASNEAPWLPSEVWKDKLIPVANDVLALGVGHDASGNRVILAGISTNGLYRKTGDVWFGPITNGPFGAGPNFGVFVWKRESPIVYAICDNSNGTSGNAGAVWRSKDAGITWTKIYNAKVTYQLYNVLRLDPVNPNYLYISSSQAIHRISNAESSTGLSNSIVKDIAPTSGWKAGPIAINLAGHLFVHDYNGKLWRCLDPRLDTPVFASIADNFYKDACASTRALEVSVDGYIYTADSGRGAAVGMPVG
jgi:hypothetical protein